MKNNKSKSIIFAFLIVTLLVLSSFGSFGFSTKTVVEGNNVKLCTSSKASVTRIKLTSNSVNSLTIPLNSGKIETFGDKDFNETNYVVANSTHDEYYPSMVVSGFDALVAYESINNGQSYLNLVTSADFGRNWSVHRKLELAMPAKSPSICINPNGKKAWGTFTSTNLNSGDQFILEIKDIRDIKSTDSVIVNQWTFSEFGFSNSSNPDIVYHYNQEAPWISGFIGSTSNILGPCNNSLMFTCLNESNPVEMVLSWYPEIENCSNISIDMDDNSKILYGICEIKNATNQDLLYFNGKYVYNNNPYINISYKIFNNGPENLTHPQIFVKGDQIYIVAETDATGRDEIIIFNSSDDGDTWEDNIVTVNQPPEAAFSYSMERLNVSFFDESTDSDGYITSWYWEFGDDNTSTDKNPQHDYATPGTYKVNLTVEDNYQAVSTIFSKTIVLSNTTPIADFTYTPINPSANENISFNSTSTAYLGFVIENYTWDFGDESNLEYEQNVTHQYADNGTYIVNLTIRDDAANLGSIEKIIKVGLIADFTYDPVAPSIEDTIIFNDSSSISEGSIITNWTWNFGDGTALVYQQNTTHQYMSPGLYIVNLTIKDDNLQDSIPKEIIVKPGVSSFIPRFPMIFANETHVFCSYTLANNLFIKNSSDNGTNWGIPKQLNDQVYSVVEEYRFSDIPDGSHVIWTDNRNGNYDLYTAVKGLPDVDLMIIPESVNISKSEIPFLSTNNWINFTVKNIGNVEVNDVKVEVTINRVNQSGAPIDPPIPTNYPVTIKQLGGSLPQKSFERPLFRISFDEFIRALIDFAGIQSITVTVDPDNQFSDTDRSNNAYTLENITYAKIFPLLAKLENIFILFN